MALDRLADEPQMGAFACPINALYNNEFSGLYGLSPESLRMKRLTAELCWASVSENSELPSPRATKNRAWVGAGFIAARIACRPGLEIGVGGRVFRV
jgi:hypothetical protein